MPYNLPYGQAVVGLTIHLPNFPNWFFFSCSVPNMCKTNCSTAQISYDLIQHTLNKQNVIIKPPKSCRFWGEVCCKWSDIWFLPSVQQKKKHRLTLQERLKPYCYIFLNYISKILYIYVTETVKTFKIKKYISNKWCSFKLFLHQKINKLIMVLCKHFKRRNFFNIDN